MLSFDIADRKINIVKGTNTGGKISIERSISLDVPPEVIMSGEVLKLSELSDLITKTLRAELMQDKDAIITFSSSNIVFKELVIPKEKGDKFLGMVQNRMTTEMGIADNFSISYTIVGEAGADNPGAMKVLATACPSAVIDSYRKLFNIMGITLRSVNINCNSISRIIAADKSNLDKMPLLVIQINADMLGLVLFEEGQMAFARYEPISEEDYGTPEYISEALSENIFRMTQFNKARGGSGINNVIVYGEIGDYIKLADLMASMDIKASILQVPQQISGYENFEFTIFANAIGALYKRNKITERINFLEVDISTGRAGGGMNTFLTTAGLIALVSVVLLGGATFMLSMHGNSMKDDISDTQNEIVEVKAALATSNNYELILQKVNAYETKVTTAFDLLEKVPALNKSLLDTVKTKSVQDGDVTYASLSYSRQNGTIVVSSLEFKDAIAIKTYLEELEATNLFMELPPPSYTIDEESGTASVGSISLVVKEGTADENE